MTSPRDACIPLFVSESRRRQGLPDRVEDPAILAAVTTLLTAPRQNPATRTAHQLVFKRL